MLENTGQGQPLLSIRRILKLCSIWQQCSDRHGPLGQRSQISRAGRSLYVKSKSTVSELVNEWQGHLLSCSGQLKKTIWRWSIVKCTSYDGLYLQWCKLWSFNLFNVTRPPSAEKIPHHCSISNCHLPYSSAQFGRKSRKWSIDECWICMWHIHAGIHQNFENLKQGILKEMSEGAILFRRNFERLTVNTEMCVSAQTTFPSLHSQILSGAKAQPTSLKLRKGPCPLQTFCGSSFFCKVKFCRFLQLFAHEYQKWGKFLASTVLFVLSPNFS